jgi:type I restriction enzyme R subunit
MTVQVITESIVEEAALDWFKGLGYQYLPGPDIACDVPRPERASYADVILPDRLWAALHALNPDIPADALEDAFKKVMRSESPSLILNNRHFHNLTFAQIPGKTSGK